MGVCLDECSAVCLTGSGLLLLVSGHQHHHEGSVSSLPVSQQSRYKLTLIKHETKRISINLNTRADVLFPEAEFRVIFVVQELSAERERSSQINTPQCNYNESLAE